MSSLPFLRPGILSRLLYSLRNRGVVSTARHYTAVLTQLAVSLTPRGRYKARVAHQSDLQFARRRERIDRAFDARYGVNTSGLLHTWEMDIVSHTTQFTNHYQGVFPGRFRRWIKQLAIDYREYIFIDIGSGKGRALFLAQDFPFRQIIGIEFAKELVAICQANIELRAAKGIVTPEITLNCMDALSFQLPLEPTVLFLGNPFGPELMAPMLAHIRSSLEGAPRPFVIVYHNPTCDTLMTATLPFITRTPLINNCIVYRATIDDFHSAVAQSS